MSEEDSSNALPADHDILEVQKVRREILERAESATGEPRRARRSSMRPSESLDGAKNEGALRRRRSCLVKTVSFSATVSEKAVASLPLPATPRDEGEYVERNYVTGPIRPRLPRPQHISSTSDLTNDTPRQSRVSTPVDPMRETVEKKVDKYNKYGKLIQTVEELPPDEDPDEFGIGGFLKCGNCTVGFAPVKKKKLMFVTLGERALEFHESEKAYKSGKTAKCIYDLAIAFNVHGDHFDAKMKKCLCLMTPDETICMRPEGGMATIEGWRRSIVKAIHLSRRNKMDRVPRPEDIFDAAYDIFIRPSEKKNETKSAESRRDGFTNIATVIKELVGKKRLCLYPNMLAICGLYIEPTAYGLPTAGFPCFRASNMFMIERSTIAFYGYRENYFYIRIGKGSPYRGFEILFSVETPEVCKEINNRLKFLIERDIENRKQEMLRRPDQGDGMESLSVPSPLAHRTKHSLDSPVLTARDRRLLLARDCLSFASVEKDDSAPSSPFANYNRPRGSLGNFQVDHLSRFDQPRGSIHSLGNVPIERPRVPTFNQPTQKFVKEEPGLREALFEVYPHLRKKNSTQSERGEIMIPDQERKMSDVAPIRSKTKSQKSTDNPALLAPAEAHRPRVPPLKFNLNKPSGEFLQSLQREKELLEAAMKSENEKALHSPEVPPKMEFTRNSRLRPSNTLEVVLTGKGKSSGDYTLMKPGELGAMRVDPSDDDLVGSNDSCYSSIKNGPSTHQSRLPHLSCQMQTRAQSFGSRSPGPSRLPPTVNLPNSERKISAITQNQANRLEPPEDDPRKRAFSLGSRNFLNMLGLNEFRRLVSKRHRTSSPQNVSASGISLNSSNPSPASGSLLNSMDNLDHGRTSSDGSGRNSPAKLQTGRETPKREDDLVSIDFSNLGGKKHSMSDARRYPFSGVPAGMAFSEIERERREEEERARRDRERRAMEVKQAEEREAREWAEKKREKERKAQEKKDKSKEKDRDKDQEKEKEKEKFRPKADSGIADCTPSSSFSSKTSRKTSGCGDHVYADPEGVKFMAGIKKIKEEQDEKKSLCGSISTTSSASIQTVIAATDHKEISNSNTTADQKANVQKLEKNSADLDRKPSLCAELTRKSSVCTAIAEEDTDSRGEPAEGTSSSTPSTSRKQSTSTSSLMSPFRRLKFLSFRKLQ